MSQWKEFAPSGGGFSILFPATPQASTRVFKVNGIPLDRYFFELKGDSNYSVSYLDFPLAGRAREDADNILNVMAENAVASSGAQLVSQSGYSLLAYVGRTIKAKTVDSGILRFRLLLVGQRLYQIAVTTPGEQGTADGARKVYEKTANKFLDSFKLISGAVDEYLSLQREGILDRKKLESIGRKQEEVIPGVLGGKIISRSPPPYPPIARAAHATGTVVIALVVDEEGNVIAAQAMSGHPLLRGAAELSARGTRFEPTTLNGKPTKVYGTLTFTFNIQ